MTRTTYLGGIATLAAAVLVSTALVAQDKGSEEMSPQQQAMMAAMQEYATPGPEHAELARRVGDWTFRLTMWQAPDAPPQVSEGTAKIASVLDGRFLFEKAEGDLGGMPFEGMGFFGYDKFTKTYVWSWIDNFGTGIMPGHGTASGDRKTIHWTSEVPDYETGTYRKVTSVDRIISDDEHILTWYEATPDGKERKTMELHYTRN